MNILVCTLRWSNCKTVCCTDLVSRSASNLKHSQAFPHPSTKTAERSKSADQGAFDQGSSVRGPCACYQNHDLSAGPSSDVAMRCECILLRPDMLLFARTAITAPQKGFENCEQHWHPLQMRVFEAAGQQLRSRAPIPAQGFMPCTFSRSR